MKNHASIDNWRSIFQATKQQIHDNCDNLFNMSSSDNYGAGGWWMIVTFYVKTVIFAD